MQLKFENDNLSGGKFKLIPDSRYPKVELGR
jgi:hypothetical protein